ncbi:lysM domain receptor-like kinase 3 [Impatiens glandulifera]|uniref:lysM domain receptor-like kinase 3 n=1 Tax=Impatiens glandulifera TaxID=253017 RepID=UPI001FB08FA0|nr:lysM domain receptor-like kinase 3 [Impatiens glandulifera]
MCRSKRSTDALPPRSSRISASVKPFEFSSRRTSFVPYQQPSGNRFTSTSTTNSSSYNYKDDYKDMELRDTLPENVRVYDFSEIRYATSNFSAKLFSCSSSSKSWRCLIGGKDVIIFQRKLRQVISDDEELNKRLSLICKSSHASLIKLLGASVSGNYIYIVYEYIHGANLADCLRNPRNPNFTVLSSWLSRMKIVADLAHGFDYLHHSTGLNSSIVHKHIKTSSIIISEPGLNAKICHFGTAELRGEGGKMEQWKRCGSGTMKFGGARGYMSPEYLTTGRPTQKSDVFAFGVLVLEILSGKEALNYEPSGDGGGYVRVSLIEKAREAVGGGGGGVRRWVDKRVKDSYPVEVAEKMVRLGLDCVEDDPHERPGMDLVANQISKMYLESQIWANKIGFPIDFTVSLAPR